MHTKSLKVFFFIRKGYIIIYNIEYFNKKGLNSENTFLDNIYYIGFIFKIIIYLKKYQVF